MPLRVMTYNIRNGRGMDNHVDVDRIADVVAAFAPDLLGLQEVDVGRPRSGSIDQATRLAERLGMHATFAPAIERGAERYGIATLSRLEIVHTEQLALPAHLHHRRSEPRCALVTRHIWDGAEIELVNTHLSVLPGERPAQMAAIVQHLARERVIVLGDFNCTPWSGPYRALAGSLQSATRSRSWPSRLPFLPLDHILVRGFGIVGAGAWTGGPARVASDHLPVFAELELADLQARGAA